MVFIFEVKSTATLLFKNLNLGKGLSFITFEVDPKNDKGLPNSSSHEAKASPSQRAFPHIEEEQPD